MKWKEAFDLEIRLQKEASVSAASKNEMEEIMLRPTGKQLFLAGMVKAGDEEGIVAMGENEEVTEETNLEDDDDDDEDYVEGEEDEED